VRLAKLGGIALVWSALAGRAMAQTADGGAPPVVPDAAGPAPSPATPPPVAPFPEPEADAVAQPPPVPEAPPIMGPGDEEAKADLQQARLLPDASPLRLSNRVGSVALYGFGELDSLSDSTQSFGSRTSNFSLDRPHTLPGDERQSMLTPCASRLGARVGTSEASSVRVIFLAELGPSTQGSDLCQGNRLRHFYFALRSPIVDVLVGSYYALFGWGGKGFFPNTAAFLGVPGQLYHLEPQIRLSHIFRFDAVDFEIAIASAGSVQNERGAGEGHFGLRLAMNHWRGASAQGGGPPEASPLQVGVSTVGRALEITSFTAMGSTLPTVYGGGLAFNALIPIVPARGGDLSNALSGTIEWSRTSGLADMYPGLTGGVLFPAFPNPKNMLPTPVYMANIEPGIVTFDPSGRLRLIQWQALVLGLQYHAPFGWGRRLWLSGNLSRTRSSNAVAVTPQQALPFVWGSGCYYDLNAFVAPFRALQLALSYQATRQTFADGVQARNGRVQIAAAYFF
jgi:hypothetical protein